VRYADGDTAPSPFERPVLCAECLTTPLDGPKGGVCGECGGEGWVTTDEDTANEVVQGSRDCDECGGTGEAS
jgi:DnaJ-class molecular chaperone